VSLSGTRYHVRQWITTPPNIHRMPAGQGEGRNMTQSKRTVSQATNKQPSNGTRCASGTRLEVMIRSVQSGSDGPTAANTCTEAGRH
jgi:hypothetical protein